MTPFFSIIIPVYNVAPYLRECLDSVLAQTFTHWEAICVDDGSTDDSGVILDEYAVRDVRFRVFHQSNAGVSAARNKGLDKAIGEWICFLDADDVYSMNILEGWDVCIKKYSECDIVGVGMCSFAKKEELKYRCMSHEKVVPPDFITLDCFCRNFFLHCYKHSLVFENRFPRLMIGEDSVFWGRALDRCRQLVLLDSVNYGYRVRLGSAMHSKQTARKLIDDAMHHLSRAEIVLRSRKKYSSGVSSYLMRRMFLLGRCLRFMPTEEHGLVAKRYFEILAIFKSFGLGNIIQRIILWIVIVLKKEWLIWFLGLLPYRIYGFARKLYYQ